MGTSVESFLALSTARLAPRTVDAYKRDLADFCTWLQEQSLDGSPDEATPAELAAYVASMRAAGLAATTIARRVAALRSFFRHQVLLGEWRREIDAGVAERGRDRGEEVRLRRRPHLRRASRGARPRNWGDTPCSKYARVREPPGSHQARRPMRFAPPGRR